MCSTCRILKISTVSEFTARSAVFSDSVNIFKIQLVDKIVQTVKIRLINHIFLNFDKNRSISKSHFKRLQIDQKNKSETKSPCYT